MNSLLRPDLETAISEFNPDTKFAAGWALGLLAVGVVGGLTAFYVSEGENEREADFRRALVKVKQQMRDANVTLNYGKGNCTEVSDEEAIFAMGLDAFKKGRAAGWTYCRGQIL